MIQGYPHLWKPPHAKKNATFRFAQLVHIHCIRIRWFGSIPSGKLTQLWKMAHLQMALLNMVISYSYVSLPESKCLFNRIEKNPLPHTIYSHFSCIQSQCCFYKYISYSTLAPPSYKFLYKHHSLQLFAYHKPFTIVIFVS